MAKRFEIDDAGINKTIDSIDSKTLITEIEYELLWEYAVTNRVEKLVCYLAENGYINHVFKASSHFGEVYSPLRLACEKAPKAAFIDIFIKLKADVNQVTCSKTPLSTAAQYGDADLIEFLIKNKIDAGYPFADLSKAAETAIMHSGRPANVSAFLQYDVAGVSPSILSSLIDKIFNSICQLSSFRNFAKVIEEALPLLSIARILVLDGRFGYVDELRDGEKHTAFSLMMQVFYQLHHAKYLDLYSSELIEAKLTEFCSGKRAIELAAELLILMANSPNNMTALVARDTIAYPEAKSEYATLFKPKISEIFTKAFFEKYPFWSIYEGSALLQYLPPDVKQLNSENCRRLVEAKQGICDEVRKYFILEIANLIACYFLASSDHDLATLFNFEKQAEVGIDMEGAASFSGAVYEC